jgi:hypothetical protein
MTPSGWKRRNVPPSGPEITLSAPDPDHRCHAFVAMASPIDPGKPDHVRNSSAFRSGPDTLGRARRSGARSKGSPHPDSACLRWQANRWRRGMRSGWRSKARSPHAQPEAGASHPDHEARRWSAPAKADQHCRSRRDLGHKMGRKPCPARGQGSGLFGRAVPESDLAPCRHQRPGPIAAHRAKADQRSACHPAPFGRGQRKTDLQAGWDVSWCTFCAMSRDLAKSGPRTV